nr:MAG TPA: putative transcriptional regulator [Caudoviricetes sp.]
MKNKLREIREKLEITQDDLVKKSGISRTTISAIENNEEYVTTNKTLEKIAEALKLNVPDIFFTK